ncbi:MAG: inorganic phosphate transporter [Candidatus Hadarchaeum sp.]
MSSVMDLPWQALLIIAIALVFDFLNGLHDSSNIVATMIASQSMGPRTALWLTAICNGAGPFLFGVAVATTIGHEVVAEQAITVAVIASALVAAVVWNVFTWQVGIPSSSSHALIGGIIGAAVTAQGFKAILLGGLLKVVIALLISPPLGFLAGFLVVKLALLVGHGFSPRINDAFRRGQWLTAVALALSHGTNDAQKTMGIITMSLVATGVLSTFHVPTWVIVISAAAIALGTVFGGWSLIKTLGRGFYKVRPVHGFGTQVASAAVILGAALLGGPVSTTQVVGSAIMGAGSAERLSKVRWGLAGQIVWAWLLTIPASGTLSGLIHWLIADRII